MWLGRDPAIIRDPACIAYLIYTAPASKQDPALIWTRLINGHIRYMSSRSAVLLEGEKSDLFNVEQGMTQGCSLSPYYFQYSLMIC